MNPLVSVIIPCYNQAKFIAKAIDNILQQTYSATQIIVVNDGSMDNIAGVMAHYTANPRVHLINQENQGPSTARNNGLAIATGKYIQFLDADDWMDVDKIGSQVEILENNPSYGLVFCDYYMVYNDTEVAAESSIKHHLSYSFGADMFDSIWLGNVFGIHCALLRRELLERYGNFNPALSRAEDHELWLRLSANGVQMFHQRDSGVYYRRHEYNVTNNDQLIRQEKCKAKAIIAHDYPEKVAEATISAFERLSEWMQEKDRWILHVEADAQALGATCHKLQEELAAKDRWITHLEADIQALQNNYQQIINDNLAVEQQQIDLFRDEVNRLAHLQPQAVVSDSNLPAYSADLEEQIATKNEHISHLEKHIHNLESGRVHRLTRSLERGIQRVKGVAKF